MVNRLIERLTRLALAIVGILVALAALRFPAKSPAVTAAAETGARSHDGRGLRWWALRGAAVLALVAIGAGVVVVSGIIPIKASSGHWVVTAWFLKFVMQRSVATYTLGLDEPALDDPSHLVKGASHYEIGCRPCHGSPVLGQPRIAQRMTPHPPDLQETAPQYDAGELFYIVKHGVKFTGMPAWPANGRDDEVWAMAAFLRKLPELDAAAYMELAAWGNAIPDPAVAIEALDPPQAPRAIGVSCGRCHGLDGYGRGVGAFPKLAGQRRDYLYASLQAYARGERHSGIMGPVAAGLNSGEMQEVARYYASLEPLASSPGRAAAAQQIQHGLEIATRGLPDQLVPACVKCHGPGGPPRNAHYPSLAGQYADYLVLQLTLLKEGRRGGTAYHDIMHRVARQLSGDQIRAAAAYFASLPADPVREAR